MTRRTEVVWLVTSLSEEDGFMHFWIYASVERAKRDYPPPDGEEWAFDRDLSRWSWSGSRPSVWIDLRSVIT